MTLVKSQILLFYFAFLASIFFGKAKIDDALITELTNGTFDEFIKGQDMAIVEFYAEWCLHCHELEPVFLKVAENLKPHGITFGKVNIEEEKPLKIRFSIEQLPTVFMFRNGIRYQYEGPLGISGTDAITEYFLKEKAKDYLGENPVIPLTDSNFDEITSASELTFVYLYVEQCTKCKILEPVFTTAARRLSRHSPRIMFGSVNVPENMDTAKKVGFQTYPLLTMFRYGKRYNYTGDETEDGMVEYLKRQAGPPSTFLEDLAAVKKFVKSPKEALAVGFFTAETSAAILENYIESGNHVRLDLRLAHTTDASIARELKVNLNSVVVYHPKRLISKYETGYNVIPNIEQEESSEELGNLLLDAAKPLVGEVSLVNFGTLYAHRPLLVAYYDVDWSLDGIETTKYWHNLIANVAKNYQTTSLQFVIGQEMDFAHDLKALGLEDWGEDVAVGIFGPPPRKYRMTEELDTDSLTEFVDNFFSNDLVPYLRSEPVPKKGTGPVRTVVGSTFSKFVYDPTKVVILKFCVPIVSGCQDAEIWYKNAAKQYKEKDIVFGEINVELNDIPIEKLKFDDLPTFVFSPKGSTGEGDLRIIDPLPEDDRDLTLWLWERHKIKTSRNIEKEL